MMPWWLFIGRTWEHKIGSNPVTTTPLTLFSLDQWRWRWTTLHASDVFVLVYDNYVTTVGRWALVGGTLSLATSSTWLVVIATRPHWRPEGAYSCPNLDLRCICYVSSNDLKVVALITANQPEVACLAEAYYADRNSADFCHGEYACNLQAMFDRLWSVTPNESESSLGALKVDG